ncbi:MAG: dTDP-4-dehydrorhamnose 3,5-epimerase [Planctomycetaceae bacterium]
MQVTETPIPGCLLLTPRVHGDERGLFMELYQARRFQEQGLPTLFLQDNFSRSQGGTLRGLHYQVREPQGKLVQVLRGEVYDVAVDLRRSSPAFGTWFGVILSEQNHHQLYIPPGCAHGFYVLSDSADFFYKCTAAYSKTDERVLYWDDPELAISWPLHGEPLLSPRIARELHSRNARHLPEGCPSPAVA